jgi:hypothetical protein
MNTPDIQDASALDDYPSASEPSILQFLTHWLPGAAH